MISNTLPQRPAPLPPAVQRRLAQIFPPERLLTDPADCLVYGYDNSRRLALPQAVVFALSAQDVAAVVQICREARLPLVARGRGTNTTGASVPVAGGIVLSLERMTRIVELVPGDRRAECEAGVLNGDVQTAAARAGLFWAPDPTSAAFSTIGGNLACNSGGPRAVKYGTARDNVLGVEAVTGTGAIIRSGAYTTKSVVGYDLTRLLCGSEGTLAIITSASLRLLPRPAAVRTLRAVYADVEAAAAAVSRLMAQPETPAALEFFDARAIELAQAWRDCGLPAGAGALLLMDVDGHPDVLDRAVAAVAEAARGPGLVELRAAATAAEAQDLWAARKALSPALRKLAPKKVNEDVAVPVSRLSELVHGVGELSRRHGLLIVCFGHAGNGNLHVNLLVDPDDPAQSAAIDACLADLFRLVLDLHGTLSGEHGIGLVKREFVSLEIAEPALAAMRAIKHALDPDGILNPGKALPGI